MHGQTHIKITRILQMVAELLRGDGQTDEWWNR